MKKSKGKKGRRGRKEGDSGGEERCVEAKINRCVQTRAQIKDDDAATAAMKKGFHGDRKITNKKKSY